MIGPLKSLLKNGDITASGRMWEPASGRRGDVVANRNRRPEAGSHIPNRTLSDPEVAALNLLSDVARGSNRQRHDRQCRILLRIGGEGTAAYYE